jgi:anaphase-promoting complex subunit 3
MIRYGSHDRDARCLAPSSSSSSLIGMNGLPAAPELTTALNVRYGALVWALLDVGLARSAVFFAERHFAADPAHHDARHAYAAALLAAGQPHSALWFVNTPRPGRCGGCEEVRARCLHALARFREAKDALDAAIVGQGYPPRCVCDPYRL